VRELLIADRENRKPNLQGGLKDSNLNVRNLPSNLRDIITSALEKVLLAVKSTSTSNLVKIFSSAKNNILVVIKMVKLKSIVNVILAIKEVITKAKDKSQQHIKHCKQKINEW